MQVGMGHRLERQNLEDGSAATMYLYISLFLYPSFHANNWVYIWGYTHAHRQQKYSGNVHFSNCEA